MSDDPRELAANDWGTITYYPKWATLQLTWAEATQSMSDDDFNSMLQLLAEHGLQVRPKYMIIDATSFLHAPAAASLAWRDEHIVPLYNEAGVEKLAFLVTGQMPGTVEKGAVPAPDGPARFPSGWFETTERMYAWLAAG